MATQGDTHEPAATPMPADARDAIAAAITARDRGAIQSWYHRLAPTRPHAEDRAIRARLAYAAGEFAHAAALLDALRQDGTIEFEDRLRLIRLARLLKLEVPLATIVDDLDADALARADARHAPALLAVANALFDSDDAASALLFFDAAYQRGVVTDPTALMHYAMTLGADRRFDEAVGIFAQAEAARPLTESALLALIDVAIAAGRHDLADATFARIDELGHVSSHRLERQIDMLAECGRLDEAESLLTRFETKLDTRARQWLVAVIAFASRDVDAVLKAVAPLPPDVSSLLGDRAVAMGYALLARADHATLAKLAQLVEVFDDNRRGARQLAIDIAFRQQDFDAAERAITAAAASFGDDHPLIRLKTTELQAFRGDLAGALATSAAMGSLDDLPAAYLAPIVTILAEAKSWPQIMALTHRLDDWFKFDAHVATVLSAATGTGLWGELRDAIDTAVARHDSDDLRKLRLVVRERTGGIDELLALAQSADAALFPDYRERLIARGQALTTDHATPVVRAPIGERGTAIIYCTDTGYLAPAFNSINSLLMTNAAFLDDVEIRLYVEPDDVEVARDVAAALNARYGEVLTIVSSGDLIAAFAGELRTGYGLFTGGMQLSASAYYRIFAIDQLLREGTHVRALYIDSDTLVVGDVMRAFAVLNGTVAMAARPETDKFEVRRVEALHGLARGRYFNSGVLAIDLSHVELPTLIAATLRQVSDHADALVYHDQCALNLGFRGRVVDLPDAFNSFCTPSVAATAPGGQGVVLHFLDRPKPWQSGYDGVMSALWYRYWRAFARVVDRGVVDRLTARSRV